MIIIVALLSSVVTFIIMGSYYSGMIPREELWAASLDVGANRPPSKTDDAYRECYVHLQHIKDMNQ